MSTGNQNSADVSCLETLFPPLRRSEFLENYWLQRLYVIHGQPSRFFAVLGSIPKLDDLFALAADGGHVQAQIRTISGNHFSFLCDDPSEARRAFEAGAQLYIHLPANMVVRTPIQAWAARLKEELGVPTHWGEIGLYAANVGGIGVDWHFDANENFMFHLSGRKTWRFSRNDSFICPLQGHLFKEPPSKINEAARCSELPITLPEDIETVVFEPGSAAYIPRGLWHETTSCEGSLSVAVTWTHSFWGEAVLCRLLDMMAHDANWRQSVRMALADDPSGHSSARKHIVHELLPKLRALVDQIASNPDMLLSQGKDTKRLTERLTMI
jgi:50S ribosomal protein L16 3-hydroxylase